MDERKKRGKNRLPIIIFFLLFISTINYFGNGITMEGLAAPSEHIVQLAFFYESDSEDNLESIEQIILDVEDIYSNLDVAWYDVTDRENETLAGNFFNGYNVPEEENFDYPFLFIGDFYFSYDTINSSSISEVIEGYEGTDVALWPEWTVTWSTGLAFFYNSSSPYITGSGNSALSIIRSLDRIHVHSIIIDLNDSEHNNDLLQEYFIEYSGARQSAEVAVFIGNDSHFLRDDEITYGRLNDTLLLFADRTTPLKNVSVNDSSRERNDEICVLIFYYPTCRECVEALDYVREMKRKDPRLNVTEYNCLKRENEALKQTYFEHFGLPRRKWGPLGVIIGDEVYTNPDDLEAGFENEVKRYPEGCDCPELDVDEDLPEKVFRSFGIMGIIIAGIIDGVNPCAFVTIIFFTSYLLIRKKEKRDIFFVGLSFTLGVFITYLLMGIGIYRLLYYIKNLSTISSLMYPITGVMALIFGIYSILDYIKVKRGKAKEMTLQLPDSVKKLSRKTIRTHLKSKNMIILAAFTGAVVSLLEFMCTGQVYLPTIVLVIGNPDLRARALFYLVIYNLMFIWPLVVIFFAAYYGATSKKLVSIFEKHLGLTKILMAVLFFILAAFMFVLSYS